MFNYQNLESGQFEELCRDIMQVITGKQLHTFAKGQDGGVDLTDNSDTHNIVVQVKHYEKSSFSTLKRSLEKEIQKVDKLGPEKYYLCISQSLTDSNIKAIYKMFSSYMESPSNIVTLDDIDHFLHDPKNIQIARSHTKLWLESGITLQLLAECFPNLRNGNESRINNTAYNTSALVNSDGYKDVFICAHHDATETARKIYNSLIEADISCWFSSEYIGKYSFKSIFNRTCNFRIFLLVLDEKANHSDFVLKEVQAAFSRLNTQKDLYILPIRIDECALSEKMRLYIGRMHIMNGRFASGDLCTQELVGRVKSLLEKNVNDHSQNISRATKQDTKAYKLINLIQYPDIHFVGRDKEIKCIEDQLQKVDNKIFLVGMGGVGKSEIARMYVMRNAGNYENIVWVSFQESIQHTFANDNSFPIEGIIRSDYPLESEKEYAERKINILKRISNRKTLLVVDNYDVTYDSDIESFCSGQYCVIFTTRNHQRNQRIRELDILPINNEKDLMNLFQAEYIRPLTHENIEIIKKIIHHFEGHTLSVRLIASSMKERRIHPEQMLSYLENKKYARIHIDNQADRIFERLKDVFDISQLKEEELYILKNLSLISNKGIEVETLYSWCEINNYDIIDDLIRRSWIVHEPVQDSVHLHPLIGDIMKELLFENPNCCNKMLRNFYRTAMNASEAPYKIKYTCYEISTTLWNRLPDNNNLRDEILETKIAALFDLGLWSKAFPDCELLISICKKREQVLYGYSRLALGYILLRKAKECLSAAQAGYDLVKDLSPEQLTQREGYLRSWIMLRISEAYNLIGNYDEALKIEKKCYEYCDIFFTPTPESSRHKVQRHIASTYYGMRKYDKGMDLLLDAAQFFESVKDFRSAAYAYERLGLILAVKGMKKEALAVNKKAENYLIPLYGAETISIASVLEVRAQIFAIFKDDKKAVKYWNQAIVLFEKMGAENRVTFARNDMEKALNALEWRPILV